MQLKTEREIAAADRTVPVIYYCFDLLYFAGVDLRKSAYRDRRRYLAQCLLPSPLVQLVQAAEDGVALQEAALASGFEGVIGKRKDSRYEAGRRSASWLKIKPVQTAEFVIGGYTKGKGSRAPLGALLVGTWAGNRLRFASHVGSGFDESTLAQLKKRLEPLKRSTCPFDETPELPNATTWVEPKLVAEVRFHSWTEDHHLRPARAQEKPRCRVPRAGLQAGQEGRESVMRVILHRLRTPAYLHTTRTVWRMIHYGVVSSR